MNLPAPAESAVAAAMSGLVSRFAMLRKLLPDEKARHAVVGRLLIAVRDGLYPSLRILRQADGTVVVTIPTPVDGE